MLRIGALLAGLTVLMASHPALAQTMTASEARSFVVGKLFTFNCFEGTKGAGRIQADGSVAEGLITDLQTHQPIEGASVQMEVNKPTKENPYNYPATDYANHELLTPGDYSTFGNIRNYQYTGPTGLNNIDQIQQQAQQTQNLGNLTQSTAGRAALLGKYVNNPQYNSYQQNLDSLYLQNSQPAFKQAYNSTQNLYNQAQQAANNATGQVGLAQNGINTLKNNVNSGINTRQSDELTALQNLASQYGTQQTNDINNLKSDLSGNKINDQESTLTGLKKGQSIYNLAGTVGNYLTPNSAPNAASASNVADRAKLNSLMQLAGNTNPALDLSQTQYDPNNPYTFDKGAFQGAYDTAASNYNKAYSTAANPLLNTGVHAANPGPLGRPDLFLNDSPNAEDQLKALSGRANDQGVISGPNGAQYNVSSQIKQLQDLLNGIQTQYGANNILQ